ncbi:MAG: RluA family pseudouridine synthase [Brevibacillus sp.]|nr:RluA family pseudouridine synthase [Brevibacillus sp.]
MIAMEVQGEWLTGTLPHGMPVLTAGTLLREYWKLPRKTVHLLFQEKGVRVDGEVCSQNQPVRAGQAISLHACQPEPLGVEPFHAPLEILYEDDHLLVVNKPAGCLLHPTGDDDRFTLDHLVAGHFARTGIAAKVRHIHRLDRETSGAVLYAKHALACALLDEQLRQRHISRQYIAFVNGRPRRERGTIDEPIGRDRHHPVRRRVTRRGETAVTHYRVLNRFREAALLACTLDTGRTHQIRVHCQHIGHPLLGDRLYGGPIHLIDRVSLHAVSLQLLHPFGEHIVRVEAGWPDDLLQLHMRLSAT